MKRILHLAALKLETLIDRWFGRTGKGRVIDPYIGYATPESLVIRGRVLSKIARNKPADGQRLMTNIRQMLSLFLTDEVADVTVRAGETSATSDDEGYFSLTLPRLQASGWHEVAVSIEGFEDLATCPALVPREDARFLVISDIDDTMIETGAYVLWKNLWTSLTGNALTRRVFADAVSMMTRLSDEGRNPVFYVSSSPWNFHYFLEQIFTHAALVRGPMFLRDLGISESQFVTGTHGDHKGSSIDTILAANPTLPAILIGDTGQHDAQVYLDAIARHAGRIHAVVLREPGPGPNAEVQGTMMQIEATGTRLYHAPDFKGMEPEAGLS
ncbi:phosphatase domain-containing protein [Litoreibacter janthinus]|uniref:Phosphatidate phosphatase APP1 n=1 Tax=Litoreibacter janthinus TaxID=670154 RepID=A0A1I6FXZ2_9RHOB|nr:phosphatase domain-containing protein [Litoreibacter janthinus]SFR34815.1 Phosphatidate phosphatase APP1 [Litoreibacter janthinus]